MIELQNASKHYLLGKNVVKAVNSATLTVNRKDFMVITGRSGSGKTTLLSLMCGLTKPTLGRVLLNHVDISTLSDSDLSTIRNRKVGFIFQFPSLIPFLTVLDNVRLPSAFAETKNDDRERGEELLERLGLDERINSYPSQLSMGEQKRVAIARALVNEPDIVLADEPTSELDETTEKEVMEIISEVHKESATVVMVTHSSELARYGSRHLRMVRGILSEK